MKIIALIFLIFVISKVISEDGTVEFNIHSQNGVITLNCNDFNACQISINNHLIEEIFYIIGAPYKVVKNLEINGFDLYLISLYNGDGCPNMYFIIELNSDKNFIKTQTFGNCNEFDSIKFSEKDILFKFASDTQASRNIQVYEYSLQNHTLKRTN
jgi:hypothetical protein